MSQSVQLPRTLVLSLVLALAFSAALHIVCAIVYGSSDQFSKPDNRRYASPGVLAALPLSVREAALDTMSTERFGLNASDEDWTTLLPPGEGFFYDPHTDVQYLVSQYHQVHCLRAFKTYFNRINAPDITLTPKEYGHISHCLQYMRQMVMCSADTTLEPALHKQLSDDGKVVNTVTGVGITHRCKDWGQIWGYVEDNYHQYQAIRAPDAPS